MGHQFPNQAQILAVFSSLNLFPYLILTLRLVSMGVAIDLHPSFLVSFNRSIVYTLQFNIKLVSEQAISMKENTSLFQVLQFKFNGQHIFLGPSQLSPITIISSVQMRRIIIFYSFFSSNRVYDHHFLPCFIITTLSLSNHALRDFLKIHKDLFSLQHFTFLHILEAQIYRPFLLNFH